MLCHKPDKRGGHEIEVSKSALPAHMAHGDTEGACTSTGTTDGFDDHGCRDDHLGSRAGAEGEGQEEEAQEFTELPCPRERQRATVNGNGNSGHQKGGGKK